MPLAKYYVMKNKTDVKAFASAHAEREMKELLSLNSFSWEERWTLYLCIFYSAGINSISSSHLLHKNTDDIFLFKISDLLKHKLKKKIS